MSSHVYGPTKTWQAGVDLGQYVRVRLGAGGTLELAGIQDSIGTTERVAKAGERVAVRLWSAEGSRTVVASGAISYGSLVEAAADGKVQAFTAGTPIGQNNSSDVAADGDHLEVIPVKQA